MLHIASLMGCYHRYAWLSHPVATLFGCSARGQLVSGQPGTSWCSLHCLCVQVLCSAVMASSVDTAGWAPSALVGAQNPTLCGAQPQPVPCTDTTALRWLCSLHAWPTANEGRSTRVAACMGLVAPCTGTACSCLGCAAQEACKCWSSGKVRLGPFRWGVLGAGRWHVLHCKQCAQFEGVHAAVSCAHQHMWLPCAAGRVLLVEPGHGGCRRGVSAPLPCNAWLARHLDRHWMCLGVVQHRRTGFASRGLPCRSDPRPCAAAWYQCGGCAVQRMIQQELSAWLLLVAQSVLHTQQEENGVHGGAVWRGLSGAMCGVLCCRLQLTQGQQQVPLQARLLAQLRALPCRLTMVVPPRCSNVDGTPGAHKSCWTCVVDLLG